MLKVSKDNCEQSLIHRHVGHGKAQAIVIHDVASGDQALNFMVE